mmetsp:Transcript_100179/g.312125  ORF Transcript_100179/g.312125 Transcript_100179/m.312125 type:complete len:229 (-) Transcript_100179:9-695(-)
MRHSVLPGGRRAGQRRVRGGFNLQHVWRRHRAHRLRFRAPEPRGGLRLAAGGPPELAGGQQAALPHPHPLDVPARRGAVLHLHQHGRLHAAPGPGAEPPQPHSLRHGSAALRGRAAVLHRRGALLAAGDGLPRGGHRRGHGGAIARHGARGPGGLGPRPRIVRPRPDHPTSPRDWGPLGRFGRPRRWPRHRLLTPRSSSAAAAAASTRGGFKRATQPSHNGGTVQSAE